MSTLLNQVPAWLVYALPLSIVMLIYVRHQRRLSHFGRQRMEEAVEQGLTEPPSLHPVIDPAVCIGAAACVRACPEQALSIIDQQGVLTNASHCIGHGACAASCPVGAISLVFGTERRGVDIPQVKPTFESNVDGIYIAGELGGMGLVGKSTEQGRQAVESMARTDRSGGRDRDNDDDDGVDHDVVIVGTGPAGLSAALTAKHLGLRYVVLEQEHSLGGTVYHYPRNKVVMTHPLDLAIIGRVRLGQVSKEDLLEFWNGVVQTAGIEIRFGQQVNAVNAVGAGFQVVTTSGQWHGHNVLLALGRRGTPRKLDVAGEDDPKVVYSLIDPQQYQGKRVLVVGGGDSAIEAALSLSEQPGTDVTLSYRAEAFSRAKPANRDGVTRAGELGSIRVLLGSTVDSITPTDVTLRQAEQQLALPNDAVIVCAGGVLPMGMLRDMGVMVETRFGDR